MNTSHEEAFRRAIQIVAVDGSPVEWGVNKFPDGQLQFKIKMGIPTEVGVNLTISIHSSEMLDLFNQIMNTVRVHKCRITYLYGARSDKSVSGDWAVCNLPLTQARTWATFIGNSFTQPAHKTQMEIVAPHCDKLLWAFYGGNENPRSVWPIHSDIANNEPEYDLVVFPDLSALDRYRDYAPKGVRQVVCQKEREQETGKIIKHVIPDITGAERILVMDDLCDGGRSFIDIADVAHKSLNGVADRFDLYVTHGIFSQGIPLMLRNFSNIWTTNSLPWMKGGQPGDLHYDNVHVLDVWGQ